MVLEGLVSCSWRKVLKPVAGPLGGNGTLGERFAAGFTLLPFAKHAPPAPSHPPPKAALIRYDICRSRKREPIRG